MDSLPATKVCTKCGLPKDLETGFSRNKSTRDGYQYWCKNCSSAATTTWRAANPKAEKARRGFRFSGPLLPDQKICSACGEMKPLETGYYRMTHSRDGHQSRCKVCCDAGHAAWVASHPEKASGGWSTWAAADPEEAKARRRVNMAALRAQAKEKVFAHYGQWCACCRSTKRLSIDHIDGDGAEHRKQLGKHGGGDFW